MILTLLLLSHRSTMKRLRLVILTCLLFLQADARIPTTCITDLTNRAPAYTDISVTCGTQDVSLSIYLCPIYYADYNESLMVLNNHINNPLCYGTADWTVSPPVLKFSFPINDSFFSSCGIIYQITTQAGTGQWADFSNVQTVNISGMVTAVDPSVDVISYRQQILYKFSCAYPLQYLLNNTEVTVSGANVAIRDENATFTSTLSMQLYKDKLYKEVLIIPPTGLKVMSRIYVKVDATNLTAKFNVMLDRCFTTTNPSPMHVVYHDLFVGCTCDQRTKVVCNGVSQTAHFNFETFRFVEQINQTISTFYVHCTTRLCDVATCRDLMPDCNATAGRRKRAAAEDVPTSTTISSRAIHVSAEGVGETGTSTTTLAELPWLTYSLFEVAIIVCIVILVAFMVALTAYSVLHVRRRKQLKGQNHLT
ncbi:zona pellucida-like domain-containing protein 1 [Nothobranchius furzeri]|uniref:Zona pellucida-like domain-containing protein 1 n=1 Tax=Nothobranchius furzeri TaxID=105023 RepID=A0A9D2YDK0_NOTFU|nr:zona pellucida-like domain-containing protein 1 [Nothobranchius furzeri]KAF7218622.1 zona pellucida-like domain-containing protein 1 [Nothobranchius furzeri]